jgi:hypothetical protein
VAVDELVERLAHLSRPRDRFKPSKYSGDTDIELFIEQFLDIAEANHWSGRETTLHLRSALEGPAAECGRGSDSEEIIEDLRARFGITAKLARTKLGQLQKKTKQTYHELGSEVNRLVKIAYPRQGRNFRTETSLEVFSRALNHKSLQQHLLARPHETLAEAVRICNEFSLIEGSNTTHKTSVANINAEEEPGSKQLDVLTTAIQELARNQAQLVASLAQTQTPPTPAPVKRSLECYICKGPHLKRNCPSLIRQPLIQSSITPNSTLPPAFQPAVPVVSTPPVQQSGNSNRPAQ